MRPIRGNLVFIILIVSVLPAIGGQPIAERGGYYSLPTEKTQWLLGAARDIQAYRTLTPAQRSTYEAIMIALWREDLLDIVDAVTGIWGEAFQDNGLLSPIGTDQFRLSVELSPNAVKLLEDRRFQFFSRGHVKLSSGGTGRNPHSARAPSGTRYPRLQISWLSGDSRIGEIDLDYRAHGRFNIFSRHLDPANSDIRDSHDDISHYCMYRMKYGTRLNDWWKEVPEDCVRNASVAR